MPATFTPPLIAAEELAELLAAPPPERPTVLDVRWQLLTGADRQGYLEGHVPSAAFVDLDRQLSDPPSGRGRHPLPSAERFGAEMQARGVSTARPVVVYDAGDSLAAARAWWLLRYFGHPRVAVLDGGLAAWSDAGQPLETGAPAHEVGDFAARPGSMPIVTAEEAAAVAAAGVLLDARAEERFQGLVEPVDPVAGHIPGARNRPTTENVDAAGRFLDPGRLRSAFERQGVRDGVPVATYCGSGITAAHELLALELAGFPAALYAGSWSEWVTDPARAVARGDDRPIAADSVEFSPDLYRGTAEDYDRFRLPYPQALIDDLVARVDPSGGGELLDLACGTGQLTFALVDRFGRVWAVDQEPDMIAVVSGKAARADGVRVRAVVSSAEDLAAPAGAFELVTIGNAFHRLKRDQVAVKIVHWLRPGGCVALVWSGSPWHGKRDWHAVLRELIDRWRARVAVEGRVPRGWDEVRRRRPDRVVLEAAGLQVAGVFRFPKAHDWTIEALTGLVYSTSMLPRAVLGSELPAFEREVARTLEPYATDGVLSDTLDFAYELARAPAFG
jgi:thiosulfate/3-mercaptopyruvate sulfurtransferase